MKKFKKILSLLLASAMILSLASCGPKQSAESKKPEDSKAPVESSKPGIDPNAVYERGDDEEIYNAVLGDFGTQLDYADESTDPDTRYVRYAKAEADLLASAAFLPNTTSGGTWAINRIVPRTIPYVQWGNDTSRYRQVVISGEFLTADERAELLGMWKKAAAGEGEYNAAVAIQWLKDHGHTVKTEYNDTFSTMPVTIDWLNTSSASDSAPIMDCVDGLVEYNNLTQMQPSMAESWEISEDGTVYTFHIRQGCYWYTSEGRQYAEVTANDFVAGFRHMMDAKAGLEWLVDGVVKGATAYYSEGGAWEDVGYKAVDKYTLEVTLEKPIPYFLTMLTYSCFMPICESFFLSRGGAFGVDEYAAAQAEESYTFGKNTDVASNVYCGAFLLQSMVNNSEIKLVRNTNYYRDSETTINSKTYIYDDGSNPQAFYDDVVKGTYTGISLGTAQIMQLAKNDGNVQYAYITDTGTVTYFGGLNLNRGTFALSTGACASTQTEVEKISTHNAMLNRNFRWALFYAFDKEAINAPSRGDQALTNLRNMYCSPAFVALSADTTDDDGHTFPAGTFYGDMVQYYCDQLDLGIDVHDSVNGWYNPERAKTCLSQAVTELGDTVQWPIKIDVLYRSFSDAQTASVLAFKNSLEETLGKDRVIVNMVDCTTTDDYMKGGYRAADGQSANYDIYWGSGWSPDYGDPKSTLDTMKSLGAGYITKVLGLF